MATKAETIAAALRGEGCLGKSKPDEPVFVLCARDTFAPELVRAWAYDFANAHGGNQTSTKYLLALQDADAMEAWQEANGGSRIPD